MNIMITKTILYGVILFIFSNKVYSMKDNLTLTNINPDKIISLKTDLSDFKVKFNKYTNEVISYKDYNEEMFNPKLSVKDLPILSYEEIISHKYKYKTSENIEEKYLLTIYNQEKNKTKEIEFEEKYNKIFCRPTGTFLLLEKIFKGVLHNLTTEKKYELQGGGSKVEISPDGRYLVHFDSYSNLIIFDLENNKVASKKHFPDVYDIVFDKGGLVLFGHQYSTYSDGANIIYKLGLDGEIKNKETYYGTAFEKDRDEILKKAPKISPNDISVQKKQNSEGDYINFKIKSDMLSFRLPNNDAVKKLSVTSKEDNLYVVGKNNIYLYKVDSLVNVIRDSQKKKEEEFQQLINDLD